MSELIAVTDHVAIALVGASVYRDGIELRIERRLRCNGLPYREWNDLCATFMEHWPMGGQSDQQGRLRFGLILGDGERVVVDSPFFRGGDPTVKPEGHTLTRRQGGGGGGNSTYSATDSLWVWPLPPEGSMELVMQWPAVDVSERRVRLDGTQMRRLALQAKPLWD